MSQIGRPVIPTYEAMNRIERAVVRVERTMPPQGQQHATRVLGTDGEVSSQAMQWTPYVGSASHIQCINGKLVFSLAWSGTGTGVCSGCVPTVASVSI